MAKNFDEEVLDAEVKEVEEMEEQQASFKDGIKICWNAVKRSKLAKGLAIGAAAAGAAAGGIVLAGKIMAGKEISEDENYYAILDHHEDDVNVTDI